MTLDELRATFDLLEDWEERFRLIIELGQKLTPLTEAEHNDVNKVLGCMSQVWLVFDREGEGEGEIFNVRGDSDAHIVRGIIAVILMIYSGKTAAQILATNHEAIFAELDLANAISMNRRNGLYAMVAKIRALAAG